MSKIYEIKREIQTVLDQSKTIDRQWIHDKMLSYELSDDEVNELLSWLDKKPVVIEDEYDGESKSKGFSIEREKELFQMIESNEPEIREKAIEELLDSQKNLIEYYAYKYANRGVPIDDLRQEGSLGLLKAIDKFDYHLGNRFSTYAKYWIHQAISRCIAVNSRTIQIPVSIHEKILKMKKLIAQFNKDHDREPTIQEISSMMKEDANHIETYMTYANDIMSLDYVDKEEDRPLYEVITDPKTEDIRSIFEDKPLTEAIREALAQLDDRDREILEMRFGLKDGKAHKLEEISKIFNISAERVRVLQEHALIKLKNTDLAEQLKEYLSQL